MFFPDLPGCTSAGDTLQEATLNAEEALTGHLTVSIEHGDAIPDASAVDEIKRDPAVDEAVRLLVRGERPGKFVRVQISMEECVVARIHAVTGGNRSKWLARVSTVHLASAS